MFFQALGKFVTRFWLVIIAFWVGLAVVLVWLSPKLGQVVSSEQAHFLPDESDSVQAKKLLDQYFPKESFKSRVVLIAEKSGPINQDDLEWLDKTANDFTRDRTITNIRKILTPLSNPLLKDKLISRDKKAAIAIVYLDTGFTAKATQKTVSALLKRINDGPRGLKLAATGDAVVGTDYHRAMGESLHKTTWATLIMLILILLFIFRSPITPVVSLASILLAFSVAKCLIALLAQMGANVSPLTEIFLVVVMFGAGTDYCVFLIFRYVEEITRGKDPRQAVESSVQTVGEAISSSALTVIIGLGSLIFAKFGPFSQTGPYVALGVAIALAAGLTLTPALILALSKILFWPARSFTHDLEPLGWKRVAGFVTQKPLRTCCLLFIILAPFIYFGLKADRSFDLLRELPEDFSARQGLEVLKNHYSQGEMSPLVLVLQTDKAKLNSSAGLDLIYQLTKSLSLRKEVREVRSAVWPIGDPKPSEAGLLRTQVEKMNAGLAKLCEGAEKMQAGIDQILEKLNGFEKGLEQSVPSKKQVLPQELAKSPEQTQRVLADIDRAIANIESSKQEALEKSKGGIFLFPNVAGGEYEKAAQKLATLKAGLIKIREGLSNLSKKAQAASKQIDATLARARERQGQAQVQISELQGALSKLSSGIQELSGGLRKISTVTQGWMAPASPAHNALDHLALPLDLESVLVKEPGLKDAMDYYIAPNGNATRLTLVLNARPYSVQEKDDILRLKGVLKTEIEELFPGNTHFHFAGSGSTILDERIVTDKDFYRIMVYILGGVFLVLLLLLRDGIAPLYLIASMIFSYFVSLGLTSLVFEHAMGMVGLDWKVSFFMFVLLVALGEDYNIFLMARIKEETGRLGLVAGVQTATVRTGPLITYCGLIMAATFLSLMIGPIEALIQLGFGITVGVLLDTFVVRPMLVPALVCLLGR